MSQQIKSQLRTQSEQTVTIGIQLAYVCFVNVLPVTQTRPLLTSCFSVGNCFYVKGNWLLVIYCRQTFDSCCITFWRQLEMPSSAPQLFLSAPLHHRIIYQPCTCGHEWASSFKSPSMRLEGHCFSGFKMCDKKPLKIWRTCMDKAYLHKETNYRI